MASLEKSINLGYLFLTFKPGKKTINTCTTFFCMYWYVSIYSEERFWSQYLYPKLSLNNGYRWCPLGKLSHLGLKQFSTDINMLTYIIPVKYNVKSIYGRKNPAKVFGLIIIKKQTKHHYTPLAILIQTNHPTKNNKSNRTKKLQPI